MGVKMRRGCKAGEHSRSEKVQKRRNLREEGMAQGEKCTANRQDQGWAVRGNSVLENKMIWLFCFKEK